MNIRTALGALAASPPAGRARERDAPGPVDRRFHFLTPGAFVNLTLCRNPASAVPLSGILSGLVVLLSLQAGSTSAQSLRCGGQLSGAGDPKSSVVQRCGEPIAVESVCVPQAQPQSVLVTGPDGVLRQTLVPQCVPMEDWTFYRGAGGFLAIVRFRNGVVESIRDGARTP